MTPDHTPASGTPETPADQRSIFEQRLAEIAARDTAAPAAETPAPGPDHGTPEAHAAAETAAHVPDEVTVDGHDVSAPQARAATHYGAETAAETASEAPAEAALGSVNPVAAEAEALHPAAAAPVVEAAASETAIEAAAPVSPATMASEIEAPAVGAAHAAEVASFEAAAPAEAHAEAAAPAEAPARGIVNPVAAEAEALHPETPAPVVEVTAAAPAAEHPAETVEQTAPALPEAHLHAAAELDEAPETVATLPTSSDTPLAEVEAAGAAEATHHGEGHAAHQTPAAPDTDPEADHTAAEDEAGTPAEAPAEADPNRPDFAGDDLPAQTQYLIGLLRGPNPGKQRKLISDLARQYEANVGNARAAARQKFADGGADAEAFAFQQPEGQQELNKALQEFRESRVKDARSEDASRADNLTKKKQLLDELRALVEAAETKDSGNKLKTLQATWKATGPVPQTDSQATWDTYHGLLDIYYSKQGRFLEMKDLDRRRNLEAKELLIKRAEALQEQLGINKALDELTKLHEEWKAIGPVPNDQREPLWQRFIAASDALHQRRKEFSDARSVVEKGNLDVKKALLERILPFADFDTDRVNIWRSKTDEIQEIKAEWEAAGLVPRAKADDLNKQYWAAYKSFFNRKNEFFKAMDSEKNNNLKAKQSLIEQVEEALTSVDWESARNVVIRAQKEWKEIGRVPEKLTEKIWQRFRAAADSFFDRPKNEVRVREEKTQANAAEHTAHLERLADHVEALRPEAPATVEGFRAHLAEWSAAFDPNEENPNRGTGDAAEARLLELLGKYLAAVPALPKDERQELLFRTEVARLKARPQAAQQLTRKEMALRGEINELEKDHATLQTNLDFFARSKNAAQLREEYQGRMDAAQTRIKALQKQLKTIRG